MPSDSPLFDALTTEPPLPTNPPPTQQSIPASIYDENILQTNEPAVAKTKGRPRGAKGKKRQHEEAFENSTRRKPSGFEYAITASQVEMQQTEQEAEAIFGPGGLGGTTPRGGSRGYGAGRVTATPGRRGGNSTGRRGGRGRGRGGATTRGGGNGEVATSGEGDGEVATSSKGDGEVATASSGGEDAVTTARRPTRRRKMLPERFRNELLQLNNIGKPQ